MPFIVSAKDHQKCYNFIDNKKLLIVLTHEKKLPTHRLLFHRTTTPSFMEFPNNKISRVTKKDLQKYFTAISIKKEN